MDRSETQGSPWGFEINSRRIQKAGEMLNLSLRESHRSVKEGRGFVTPSGLASWHGFRRIRRFEQPKQGEGLKDGLLRGLRGRWFKRDGFLKEDLAQRNLHGTTRILSLDPRIKLFPTWKKRRESSRLKKVYWGKLPPKSREEGTRSEGKPKPLMWKSVVKS